MGGHGNPNVDHHRGSALQLLGDVDLEAGPQVEPSDEETLDGALGLGEAGDHSLGAVGEGADVGVGVEGAEEADDESLGGGIGEGVGVEDDEAGDGGGGEAGGEEVNDEDAGGDEEGAAGGVEVATVVGGEVGGDLRGTRV